MVHKMPVLVLWREQEIYDIPNSYRVTVHTRMSRKILKGHNLERKKEGAIILVCDKLS